MTKKINCSDWHKSDIKAALEKRGYSLRRLSTLSGLRPDSLRNVFYRKWPKGEKIIASALDIPAEVIWPSRYIGS